MSTLNQLTPEQNAIVDEWIRLMQEYGLSYDEMLRVFSLTRQKLLAKKSPQKQCMDEQLQPIECEKHKGCDSCPFYVIR